MDPLNPVHLALYRNAMVSLYRIRGRTCHAFYSMSDEDGKDPGALIGLDQLGFSAVGWEDSGAHGTLLDDYNTPDHFERVEAFASLIAAELPGGRNDADDLILILEDLNPRLLATLGSAARSIYSASHEEDVAQAGLSTRRYITQLADTLFPARQHAVNGRNVSEEKFRNRLWAYIECSIPDSDPDRLAAVHRHGGEVDRLIKEVNAALHGTPDKKRLTKAFADLAALTVVLLGLDPVAARKPYFGFHDAIMRFARRVAGGAH